MFGDYKTCGAFPTSSPMVKRPQSILVQVGSRFFIVSRTHSLILKKKQDTPPIVRLASPASKAAHYMCFDEAYFKTLETMQWNRDNGCVELIPIVVGLA